jgi:hypothetical protein
MARKKRPGRVRPKTPARVRKQRTKAKPRRLRGHHHPELVGLGLVAAGLFLGSVLYLGWDGGLVGGALADGFRSAVGAAAYGAPVAFVALGLLMVGRSALVDVRPFRTGAAVLVPSVVLALGAGNGGHAGEQLERLFSYLLGSTGATILGATGVVVGGLLLTGASAGALLRSSGHALRRAGARPRVTTSAAPRPEPAAAIDQQPAPPVDAVHDFPDVVTEPSVIEPTP